MSSRTATQLMAFHKAMSDRYGPLHWWPGESPTEVIIGTILTQNTSWKNVEKAIANLKAARLIDVKRLAAMPVDALAEIIRPAGYYRVKAKRLAALMRWIAEAFDGDLERMFALPTARLREELLGISGVGRETADSILLYAGGHPSFVVDTYTYRILRRHKLIDEAADYDEIKELFESNLPRDVPLYNELHAQLVRVGHEHCKPRTPLCQGCPLDPFDHNVDECP